MEKTLVMNFMNESGRKSAIRISNIKDGITDAEVASAMDTILAKNVFQTTGGDLKLKDSAELIDTDQQELTVK